MRMVYGIRDLSNVVSFKSSRFFKRFPIPKDSFRPCNRAPLLVLTNPKTFSVRLDGFFIACAPSCPRTILSTAVLPVIIHAFLHLSRALTAHLRRGDCLRGFGPARWRHLMPPPSPYLPLFAAAASHGAVRFFVASAGGMSAAPTTAQRHWIQGYGSRLLTSGTSLRE